jgi:SOS-response transcriptional repressor LexA
VITVTDLDEQAYATAQRLYRERGVFPTVRELASALGLSSACTAQRRLERLERHGWITHRQEYGYRAWEFNRSDAPPTYQLLQERVRLLEREVEALRAEIRGLGGAA